MGEEIGVSEKKKTNHSLMKISLEPVNSKYSGKVPMLKTCTLSDLTKRIRGRWRSGVGVLCLVSSSTCTEGFEKGAFGT